MINIVALIFLIYETVEDIFKRSISLNSLCVFGGLGIVLRILTGTDLKTFIGGIITGFIVVLMSMISNGAIGIGDGILFLVLGVYIDAGINIRVIMVALVIAAIVSIVIVVFFRKKGCREIPFVPCILLAYVEVVLFEI